MSVTSRVGCGPKVCFKTGWFVRMNAFVARRASRSGAYSDACLSYVASCMLYVACMHAERCASCTPAPTCSGCAPMKALPSCPGHSGCIRSGSSSSTSTRRCSCAAAACEMIRVTQLNQKNRAAWNTTHVCCVEHGYADCARSNGQGASTWLSPCDWCEREPSVVLLL